MQEKECQEQLSGLGLVSISNQGQGWTQCPIIMAHPHMGILDSY